MTSQTMVEAMTMQMAQRGRPESDTSKHLRAQHISELQALVHKAIDTDELDHLECRLIPFGSTRLGLGTPTSDLDLVCVLGLGNRMAAMETVRDYLARPDFSDRVRRLRLIDKARVPLIELDWHGTPCDMSFAMLKSHQISVPYQPYDDDVSAMALAGVGVADWILDKIKECKAQASFALVMHVLKVWAAARGVVGHLAGFPASVALALVVVHMMRAFPKECGSADKMLSKFFLFWTSVPKSMEERWPALVTNPSVIQKNTWTQDWMPVVTPVAPCMNCTSNVTRHTRTIWVAECQRARECLLDAFNPTERIQRLLEPECPAQSWPYCLLVVVTRPTADEAHADLTRLQSAWPMFLRSIDSVQSVQWRPWPTLLTNVHLDDTKLWKVLARKELMKRPSTMEIKDTIPNGAGVSMALALYLSKTSDQKGQVKVDLAHHAQQWETVASQRFHDECNECSMVFCKQMGYQKQHPVMTMGKRKEPPCVSGQAQEPPCKRLKTIVVVADVQ